jgi:hypothetical protein
VARGPARCRREGHAAQADHWPVQGRQASLHLGEPGGAWPRAPLMSLAIGPGADGSSFTSLRTVPDPTGRRLTGHAHRTARGPGLPPALGPWRPPQRSKGGGIGLRADPGGHERRGLQWPGGLRGAGAKDTLRKRTIGQYRAGRRACTLASPAGPGPVLRSCPPPSARGPMAPPLLRCARRQAPPGGDVLGMPTGPHADPAFRQPSGQGDPRSEVKGEGSARGPIPEDMSGGGRRGPRACEVQARRTRCASGPLAGTGQVGEPAPWRARWGLAPCSAHVPHHRPGGRWLLLYFAAHGARPPRAATAWANAQSKPRTRMPASPRDRATPAAK